MAAHFDAHEVLNQSPPYEDVDLYRSDRPLQEAVAINGAGDQDAALSAFGRRWGSAEMLEHARLANENPPRLRSFDSKGNRRDEVEFHPSYHHFMTESIAAGLHASTWQADATQAPAPAEVARAARYFMVAQVENGHMCPVTMTRASVAAFAREPALVKMLMPKLMSRHYDRMLRPWREKIGITLGMGMTEKQGGTDVRANTTRAEPCGDGYLITGHKWFMSAPMCDAFLILAQAAGGLTCFFLPRFRADGSFNALRFQRLKDKLGNRSNASSEVEFTDALATRVGEEGQGLRTILPMVQLTRLDCAISSAGMMRAALAQALHHCRHRTVFQKKLADQPMMRTVLADLALEVEGATAAVMRLCRSFDHAAASPVEAARARLLTPAIKYWVCKTAPTLDLRSDGVSRRQRLRRGGDPGSALPRSAGQRDLGGLRQRHGARRAARIRPRDGGGARRGDRACARGARAAWRGRCGGIRWRSVTGTHRRVQRPRGGGTACAIGRGRSACRKCAGQIAGTFARTRLAGRQGLTFGTGGLGNAETGTALERALP